MRRLYKRLNSRKLKEGFGLTDGYNWSGCEDFSTLAEAIITIIAWFKGEDENEWFENFDEYIQNHVDKVRNQYKSKGEAIDALIVRYLKDNLSDFSTEKEFVKIANDWENNADSFSLSTYKDVLDNFLKPVRDEIAAKAKKDKYDRELALGASDRFDSHWTESVKRNGLRESNEEDLSIEEYLDESFLLYIPPELDEYPDDREIYVDTHDSYREDKFFEYFEKYFGEIRDVNFDEDVNTYEIYSYGEWSMEGETEIDLVSTTEYLYSNGLKIKVVANYTRVEYPDTTQFKLSFGANEVEFEISKQDTVKDVTVKDVINEILKTFESLKNE